MMDDLDRLLDELFRLVRGFGISDKEFPTPEEKENGIEKLSNLVESIYHEVKEAEAAAGGRETSRELELLHAAKATEAAAKAANAAAQAADAATVAATVSEGRVSGRAVAAALRAAGAAYRAAASARFAATAAETLPSGAYLRYEGEISDELYEERQQLSYLHQFLFQDQYLRTPGTLFSQLSDVGQAVIRETVAIQWDKLLDFIRKIRDAEVDDPIGKLLKVISESTRKLKALVREYLVGSQIFSDQYVLDRISRSDFAKDLGIARDADLRARNLAKLPDLFKGDDGEAEALSGKIDPSKCDDFLTFPGKMNDIAIKPLIDTGGGCNIVKAEWLKRHNISVDPNSRLQKILMADGSTSDGCPLVDVKWSFDGRNKYWTEVEFMVVENYQYDALIGLPFLKHTETIHNSQGKLVFPEFKKIHARKGAVPIYNFGVNPQTK
ncbi:hypothetical protein ABW19_dt0205337 [Dactylella cylindrospora]|nr:hypothetical protein ABW19_dt0205337 [Dactylella cylindrospora]